MADQINQTATSRDVLVHVVLVDTIQLTANIGADCWGRLREQSVSIIVRAHLKPSFLAISGQSDNVVDSIHYEPLTKASVLGIFCGCPCTSA
ncbi:hypothetical protein BDR05DRAFT_961230 [Suillus weaverae]|nr:hypothetical protein BDR05DRAFT_961230 [Suillus weaverae]